MDYSGHFQQKPFSAAELGATKSSGRLQIAFAVILSSVNLGVLLIPVFFTLVFGIGIGGTVIIGVWQLLAAVAAYILTGRRYPTFASLFLLAVVLTYSFAVLSLVGLFAADRSGAIELSNIKF